MCGHCYFSHHCQEVQSSEKSRGFGTKSSKEEPRESWVFWELSQLT